MIELEEHVRKLDSADEAERIYAAEDIGCANSAEGISPLLKRLPAEQSRAVREAIFGALQDIDDDAVTDGAIGLLTSEDAFVRNQAVELLKHRGAKVLPFLERAFETQDNDARKMIIDVLAAVDGPGIGEIYAQALADPDINVVITAVERLGSAGKTEFRERIESLLEVDNAMLAGACVETLSQIGNEQSIEVVRSRIAKGRLLGNFLRPSYLKMLGAYGQPQAISEAASMLKAHGTYLQVFVLDAITMLHQRYPAAPLPESLAEPLKDIANNRNSSQVQQQALRLLGGLVQVDGVTEFLLSCKEMTL